jgi:uncharacterized protein DUF4352
MKVLIAAVLAVIGLVVSAPNSVAAQAARDGKFEFTVNSVSTSRSLGGENAQGEYVILSMTVQNIGHVAQSYFSDNQKLVDSTGRLFSPDSMADIEANGKLDQVEINPGNHINVRLAFDVPPGTTPAQLVVHDSAFSGGATINLS